MVDNKVAKFWIALGASLAGFSVIMGAFGAHGVERVFDANYTTRIQNQESSDNEKVKTREEYVEKHMESWNTASRYMTYHALGIIFIGMLFGQSPAARLQFSATCFVIGIILFSGLLYALTFTDIKMLGMIVPMGGTAFILGWLVLAFSVWNHKPSSSVESE